MIGRSQRQIAVGRGDPEDRTRRLPYVFGHRGPGKRLGEVDADHIGEIAEGLRLGGDEFVSYEATRSGRWSRTAVESWRRATHEASISIGMRRYAPRWPLRRRRHSR